MIGWPSPVATMLLRACLAKVSDTFNSSTFKCSECRTLYNLILLNSIPRRLARLNCILCTLVKIRLFLILNINIRWFSNYPYSIIIIIFLKKTRKKAIIKPISEIFSLVLDSMSAAKPKSTRTPNIIWSNKNIQLIFT
jgi:hypothetical protein